MSDRNLRIQLLFQAMDRVTKPLRDIAGGSSKASQNLGKMRDRLKEIDRAQADIAGFRQIKAGVRGLETQMAGAQTKVAQLAREMASADAPTRKLAAAFDKAKREAAGLKQEHAEESAKLQQLRDRMAAAGISTSRLADHERELRHEAARTNTELAEQARRLDAAATRSQRFANGRAAFGRVQGAAAGLAAGGASAIGAGVATGAPIIGSIKSAMEYESVMTDIAQKANLSRNEARKMGIGLIAAAKSANQLPESLQQGVDVLSGFGLDPRMAVKMMTPIGRAATAYKAEIADLSAAAFAANDNLKVPIQQTARVMDVMAAAGKDGAFEMADMARHFPALTASAAALGQTGVRAVGDMAAALQITRKATGDSATAANNLQNLYNKINTEDTIKNFKQFGIDLPAAMKKAAAESKSPIEAIAELTKKATGGDLSKLSFLFGDAQVQGALRPLIQNLDEYRRIRASALGAKGVVDSDFADRLKDSSEQAKQFRINAMALGLTIGGVLLPTVNALLQKGTALAARIGAWSDRHPVLAKWIGITAAGLAALLVVTGGMAIALAGILAPFAALSFVAGALGIALLPMIGMVAAFVAGFALVAGAAYLIYNNWGGILAWFSGIWQAVKTGVGNAVLAISGILVSFRPLDLLYRAFAGVMGWLGVILPARFAGFGRNMIMGLIRGVTSMLGTLRSTIVGAASSAANWFKSKLGIRSPSRVFMGLGSYVMQGLTNGIAGGESGPVDRLTSLSKRMAAAIAIGATTPAVAGVGVAGAGSGGSAVSASAPAPITINVYGTPGMNEQALARLVAAEVAKVQNGSRSNASYADRPDWETG